MIEEKCFRIPDHAELDPLADMLGEAFAEGWHCVAHFSLRRGTIVITAREKHATPAATNGKAKVRRR